jgi:hypothetical protein
MDGVVRIAPLQNDPGLIGYECPSCSYVTSVLWQQPASPENGTEVPSLETVQELWPTRYLSRLPVTSLDLLGIYVPDAL